MVAILSRPQCVKQLILFAIFCVVDEPLASPLCGALLDL